MGTQARDGFQEGWVRVPRKLNPELDPNLDSTRTHMGLPNPLRGLAREKTLKQKQNFD